MATPPYRVDECIFEGARSLIYRGHSTTLNRSVIVKQHRSLYPSPEIVATFLREFEITRKAAGAGVIAVHEMCSSDGRLSMLLEDFGATSLARSRSAQPLQLGESLEIACQVAAALAGLHRRNIVHKDITPSNIVWNRGQRIAKLIDFGIAQVLDRESVATVPQTEFQGTPAFASPEQTGRMNRLVDCRSDLYSLGATLYDLLTGRPPFVYTDRLELVHAHLAKTPTPPHKIDARIPPQLSDIVMLLLEKRAEDRYQSAGGLQLDLERCRSEWTESGAIERFQLREGDIDEHLRIPQKLYGRDQEAGILRHAFERAARGKARVLLVTGYSGIGKTSLVREVQQSLLDHGATFVEGKFDQFDRGRPLSSLIQAFRGLARILLTEQSPVIARTRARILEAVGANGRILTEVIPELAHIIGEQPELADVTPAEARNRFQLVIAEFVHALASPEHPLVIFLDDLQWADLSTLDLLAKLATDPTSQHVLLIGAYRENEVDDSHPLTGLLDEWRSARAAVDTIHLGPLSEDDVLELVSDTLVGAKGRVRLAVLCQDKTGGNAFYLRRFLESLHADGLLWFDIDERCWQLDLEAIQSQPITENVIDFLSGQIGKLSEASRATLQTASCIGDIFDLETLSVARGESRSETLNNLREALTAELVRPAAEGFWFVEDADAATLSFSCYFVHDRIRQATRALLDDADAAQVHLRVGRFMLATLTPEGRDERLFDLVEHLNRAGSLIGDADERMMLRSLNLQAARRALSSAAFQPASAYYQRAYELLSADAWEASYDETLAIHVEGARAAYLTGDHERMSRLVGTAVTNGRSLLDRVAAQEVKIYALVSRQQFLEAVQLALTVLEPLGVSLPTAPSQRDIETAVGATLALLQARAAESIVSQPIADNPRDVAALRIQNLVMSSAYLAVPNLLPLLACNIVRTTMELGIFKESAYGFAVFGLVLNAVNMVDVAYRMAEIALGLLERIDDHSMQPKTLHVVACHVKPFVDPVLDSIEMERRAVRLGLDCGDLEYAAWGLHGQIIHGFFAGVALSEMRDVSSRNVAILEHHAQMPALGCSTPYKQAIDNLLGSAPDPARLCGPSFDEATEIPALEAINFRGALCVAGAMGTFVRYLFRDIDGATSFLERMGPYSDGAVATYAVVWWHQYRALTLLAHAATGVNPAGILEAVTADLALLRMWAGFSPVNHAHRLHLVEAEIARVENRQGEAMQLYDRAIAEAASAGFTHEEALGNELCARFHLARGSKTAARAYLLEASFVYDRWGARAKVAQLGAEFAELLGGMAFEPKRSSGGSTSSSSATTTGGFGGLDLASLFKAANLISSETRLDRLLGRVLGVAIENAGATSGYLVVDDQGCLRIGAAKDVDGVDLVKPGTMIEACLDLPVSMVTYVARTGERLVLTDARKDPRWATEQRLDLNRPTSVLCAPIDHQ
ncbi:MAG: AAA family ATPase, partial [Myxococcales bacterium]|nr:AAA family ATPase [Myxococcales bacterium]